MKIFDTGISLKHRRAPLQIFSALCDKKFSTENSDIPFLCIEFFNIRSFLKHWMVPPRIFSALWDKKIPTEKRETPHLLSIIFFHTRKYPKHRRDPLRSFFCSCEAKNYRESHDAPSYASKFSIPEFFWTTEGFSYEVFWYRETKNFRQEIVISPSHV